MRRLRARRPVDSLPLRPKRTNCVSCYITGLNFSRIRAFFCTWAVFFYPPCIPFSPSAWRNKFDFKSLPFLTDVHLTEEKIHPPSITRVNEKVSEIALTISYFDPSSSPAIYSQIHSCSNSLPLQYAIPTQATNEKIEKQNKTKQSFPVKTRSKELQRGIVWV